jgi:arsenate reductase
MAEGWARQLKGDVIIASSAGVDPGRLDSRAVTVMNEAGIDISSQVPKALAEVTERPIDVVVTVCDRAHESCPVFPGRTRVVHRGFDDPPRLARAALSEEEALGYYRRVRDEIRVFVESLPASLAVRSETDITEESI